MGLDLEGCPRCGRNHDGLEVHALNNPPYRFGSWASCPETGQPILLPGDAS